MTPLVDRLVALVAFFPVGLERLVGTAVGRRSGRVVPLVALALFLLGLFPLAQAGVELITHQATPGDVIERRAGDLTMLEVAGIGYDTGLAAGTDAEGRALRWLAMRDGLGDRRVMLVRTPLDDAELRIRQVVGRVRTEAAVVSAVTDALAARGAPGPGDPASVAALGGRVIVEATGADGGSAQRIEDPAAIAGLPDGTLVSVRLRFTGEGLAPCTLDGSCDARVLASGEGTWLLRAAATGSTQAVLVESPLPPTAFPFTLVGRQVRDPGAVDAMLATIGGQRVLGWSRALDVALIDHDPALPADRVWGGALLLMALGALLLLGRRIRYPVFRHEGSVSRRAIGVASPVAGRASGRLGLPDGAPLDVIEVPVRVEPAADVAPVLVAALPAGEVRLDVPRASATASGIEAGRMARVAGSDPALWLSWFGTDLRIAFASEADRDAAAALLVAVPPRAPATPAAPPPRPRPRRPEPDDGDEPDPEPARWRRPRPPGAR